jgi:hypothetical protein
MPKPHFTLAWSNASSLTLFNYRAIIPGDDAAAQAQVTKALGLQVASGALIGLDDCKLAAGILVWATS